MLTIKVVTEWNGTQTPPFDGSVRPAEHVFEATSVYSDAGQIICHGVEGYGEGISSVTYEPVLYDLPWSQIMYVMNRGGATVSKHVLGSFGGDIGHPVVIAPNPWRKVSNISGPVEEESDKENTVSSPAKSTKKK